MQFIISVSGAVALLIWAVRLVRTGVERGFKTQLRQWLRQSGRNRLYAAGSGLGAAVLLQSSTAVAVLVSNFLSKGGLSVTAGLAILLGADVGSALVSQILLVQQDFLIPLLLLIGVTLFLRNANSNLSQVGRILIGLSLILVSLNMIRLATGPMVVNPSTSVIMGYLGRDLFTAFLIGASFAWMVHSSVAAVLLCVTLAGQSILPPLAAAVMVLGANLGGSFIAYVLTWSAPVSSRQMVVANLLLRGCFAVIVAFCVSTIPNILPYLGADPAQQIINLHLVFNLVLVIVALPLVYPVTNLIQFIVTENANVNDTFGSVSALDPTAINRPSRGLDCAARELLIMGQKIERMLIEVEILYRDWSTISATAITKQNKEIKDMHHKVKLYLAKLGQTGLEKDFARRSMELALISTGLDAASDTIARTILKLAKRLNTQGVKFSDEGRKEINRFWDRTLGNVQLALNVMMTQNPGEARELIAAKEKVARVEQKLQRLHLGRLRKGLFDGIESSNIHQETLRALKQINASFAMVGYPILAKSGDLLKSRLA
ncbi:MAG: Na+/Pi-cotransporter [Rhodobacteraceae bacterium]|nr:Na+/Pi-cotransporter [Paracoccaceae bacterium]